MFDTDSVPERSFEKVNFEKKSSDKKKSWIIAHFA